MSQPCGSCGEDQRGPAPRRCERQDAHEVARYRATGHRLYYGGTLVGLFDTPELAAGVADELSALSRVLAKSSDRVPSRVQARDEPCADPAHCDVH